MIETRKTSLQQDESLHKRVVRLHEGLLEVLKDGLKGTVEVSPRGDEIDAIAAGINMLLEELRRNRTKAIEPNQDRLDEVLAKLQATQDQLIHSQKMEAIGRLAGGVAHDFNNLLSVMTMCAAGIAEQTDNAVLQELSSELNQAVERGARLTRQLLTFSRQQPSRPKIVNLNELIVGVDRMLRRILGDDVELVTLLAVDLWPALLDIGHWEQILVNLAVNARDAMPDGGKLTITTRNLTVPPLGHPALEEAEAGDYVALTFEDTGIGMDSDVASRVFEPFFTTKEAGQGTGLGLSTCYGIVKQAGGYIRVVSALGKGSQFLVWLPRAHEVAEVPAQPHMEETRDFTGSETILVVEDEPSVRRVIVRALQAHGYRVLEAGNASEALRLYASERDRIALLVTDVVMPYMSGPDLARQLLSESPNLKVLYVSGYIDRPLPNGQHGEKAVLLEKPFLPATLVRQVRRLLDTASRRD